MARATERGAPGEAIARGDTTRSKEPREERRGECECGWSPRCEASQSGESTATVKRVRVDVRGERAGEGGDDHEGRCEASAAVGATRECLSDGVHGGADTRGDGGPT